MYQFVCLFFSPVIVDPSVDGLIWEQYIGPAGNSYWAKSDPASTVNAGINSILPSIQITTPSSYNEIWYTNTTQSIEWTVIYDPSLSPSPATYLQTIRINLYRNSLHPNNFVRTITHLTQADNVSSKLISGKQYLYGKFSWLVSIPESYSVNELYKVVLVANGHTAIKAESNGKLRIFTRPP